MLLIASSRMSAKKRKTRSGTCLIVGCSKTLPLSEPATHRDVLAYINLLVERDPQANISEIIKRVGEEVRAIYQKVGTNLPLILDTLLRTKLTRYLAAYKEVKRNTKSAKREAFLKKLDTLFDLIACSCKILLCSETNCGGCDFTAHVECRCKSSSKIPLVDLHYVWDQRMRSKDQQSSYYIGPRDVSATQEVIEERFRRSQQGTRRARQLVSEDTTPVDIDDVLGDASSAESVDSQPSSVEEPGTSNDFCMVNGAVQRIESCSCIDCHCCSCGGWDCHS